MNLPPLVSASAALTLSSAWCEAAVMIVPNSIHDVSSVFSPEYKAENTINGSGLPAGYTPSSTHAAYANTGGGNHWTSAVDTQPLDQFITFAFDTPQSITEFHMWNHQSNGGISTNTGYGVTVFDLTFYAADGVTVLRKLDDYTALPGVSTGQVFLFDLVADVSYVRFDVEAVNGSPDYTGLGEVAFGAIPEPAGVGLLSLSLAGSLMHRRRQRSSEA